MLDASSVGVRGNTSKTLPEQHGRSLHKKNPFFLISFLPFLCLSVFLAFSLLFTHSLSYLHSPSLPYSLTHFTPVENARVVTNKGAPLFQYSIMGLSRGPQWQKCQMSAAKMSGSHSGEPKGGSAGAPYLMRFHCSQGPRSEFSLWSFGQANLLLGS